MPDCDVINDELCPLGPTLLPVSHVAACASPYSKLRAHENLSLCDSW